MKRKSAVDLTDLALGIVILGITVAIGSRMLIVYRDNRLTDLSTFNQNNQTITASDGNPEISTPTDSWVSGLTRVANATGGDAVVPTSNYTATITNGNLNLDFIGTSPWNATSVNLTYSAYNTSNPQWDLPNDAAIGLAEYGNWFDIIVIIGVAGVILSLIFLAFNSGGGMGGGDGGVTY